MTTYTENLTVPDQTKRGSPMTAELDTDRNCVARRTLGFSSGGERVMLELVVSTALDLVCRTVR